MALQIMRNPALLPDLDRIYLRCATVSIRQKKGLDGLFLPPVGSAVLAPHCDPAHPEYRVVAPKWKNGQAKEWETLEQCYEKLLTLAAGHHCDAIRLPMLTSGDPDFPAYIDYKIAVDTIQTFLEKHTMEVFLLVFRPSSFQMPELREDVERFLARNYWDGTLLWSDHSFAPDGSRFDTLVPGECELYEDLSWQEPDSSDWDFDSCPGGGAGFYGEASASPEMYRPDIPPAPPCAAPQAPMSARETGRLPKITFTMDAGFSETLLKLIDNTGKKDSEIYNKANVSRQHFSKIRNNPDYKPTKATAVAFAIALELDLAQTQDLIGRAGYVLTRSSKFDVIIMYFIENRIYNMFDINETLYEYDQHLLGA